MKHFYSLSKQLDYKNHFNSKRGGSHPEFMETVTIIPPKSLEESMRSPIKPAPTPNPARHTFTNISNMNEMRDDLIKNHLTKISDYVSL